MEKYTISSFRKHQTGYVRGALRNMGYVVFTVKNEAGPYYYACWKGRNGRLKKKYIGKYPPEVKPINSNDKTKATNLILTQE